MLGRTRFAYNGQESVKPLVVLRTRSMQTHGEWLDGTRIEYDGHELTEDNILVIQIKRFNLFQTLLIDKN